MKHLPPRFYVAAAAMTALALMMPVLVFADSGRWKDNGNQTLTDTFTGLVWTKHDNLHDINLEDAKRYCDTLSLAGARWRLPETDELAALFTSGADGTTPCGSHLDLKFTCQVSSLFYLTGPALWSAADAGEDNRGARGWLINLNNGDRDRDTVVYAGEGRALCVRRS